MILWQQQKKIKNLAFRKNSTNEMQILFSEESRKFFRDMPGRNH